VSPLRELQSLELEIEGLALRLRQLGARLAGWELLARAGVSEVDEVTADKLGLVEKQTGEISCRN